MSSLFVTLIQTDLAWENKDANRAAFEQKIRAINGKTEVVVLPEMFSTGFSMRPAELAENMQGPTVEWMKAIAAERRIILTGSLIIEENGKYYNRALWVLPNGQVGSYDKHHLFAYGNEHRFYTPGDRRFLASVKGFRTQPLICYDLRFPVWARQQSSGDKPEYDVLIYMANWPSPRVNAWKTLLQARAIENQCYVIGVNRFGTDGNNLYHTGDSMAIGPLGEILYHAPEKEDVYTVELSMDVLTTARTKFPFWKDADGFQLLREES